MRRGQLNDRQLVLLERVAGGDLAAADNGAKLSANALHQRGLLRIRRSPWRAAITDAGRFYLEHGQYPGKTTISANTSVDQATRLHPSRNGPARTQPPNTTSSARSKRKRPPPHTTARISAERRAAAVGLVNELVAAGEKVIKNPDDAAQTYWRQVVDFAKRNQLVPDGRRIEKTRTRRGELRVRLLSGPHSNSRHDTALSVVPMPTELRGLHPVVKALQDDSGRIHIAGSLRQRCLLYLHGLTREAERRGYTVQRQPIDDRHRGRITTYGRSGVPDYSRRAGELNIVVNHFFYRITIDQEHPEADELERYCQLVVMVRGPGQPNGCRYRWYDRTRTTIDDSIASVLREIEAWAAQAKREKDDRQAHWQAAMDEATRLVIQDRLVAELEQQVRCWRLIQDLRQYCDALEARIEDADDGEPVDEAKRWLAWARDHAEIMNPLFQLPVTPTPKLRTEELESYLDGWSPMGPEVYVTRWRGLSYRL